MNRECLPDDLKYKALSGWHYPVTAFVEQKVTLIEAPAGYGKTSLLNTWKEKFEQKGRSYQFIRIDKLNMGRLLSLINDAVQALKSGHSQGKSVKRGHTPDFAVLMIDGWEFVSARILKDVEYLIATADDRLGWVIASRTRIELDLADQRMCGLVRNLRAEDLMMDDDKATSQELPTGGWPAITRIWSASAERYSSIPIEVRDYICRHVVNVMTADELQLLSQLSILDMIPTTVANHMSERLDAPHVLSEIAERTFLVKVTSGSASEAIFEIREPLRQYLLYELEMHNIAETTKLRLKVARFLEDEGDLTGACQHLLDAREWYMAAQIIENLGVLHSMEHGLEHQRKLLLALPTSVRMAFPRLQLAWVYVSLRAGEVEDARRAFQELSHNTHNFWTDREGGDVTRLQIESKLVEFSLSCWSGTVIPMKVTHAYEVFIESAPLSPSELVMAHMLQTYCNLQSGDLQAADRAIRLSAQISGISKVSGPNFWQHLYSAWIARERCQVREAQLQLSAAADEMACGHPTQEPNHSLWLDMVDAELKYELNNTSGLQDSLNKIILRANKSEIIFVLLSSAYLTLASCMFIESGMQKALDVLQVADNFGVLTHQPAFNAISSAHRVRLLLRAGQDKLALDYAEKAGLLDRLRRFAMYEECTWMELLETALAAARCEIFKDAGSNAYKLLLPCMQRAENMGCLLGVAKMSLVAAVALDQACAPQKAGTYLSAALNMLLPQRLYRPLIDEARVLGPLLTKIVKAPALYGLDPDTMELTRTALGIVKGTEERPWMSSRESSIIHLLHQGKCNKSIARHLNIAESTVKYHLKNIYAKLGVSTRQEAVTATAGRKF